MGHDNGSTVHPMSKDERQDGNPLRLGSPGRMNESAQRYGGGWYSTNAECGTITNCVLGLLNNLYPLAILAMGEAVK